MKSHLAIRLVVTLVVATCIAVMLWQIREMTAPPLAGTTTWTTAATLDWQRNPLPPESRPSAPVAASDEDPLPAMTVVSMSEAVESAAAAMSEANRASTESAGIVLPVTYNEDTSPRSVLVDWAPHTTDTVAAPSAPQATPGTPIATGTPSTSLEEEQPPSSPQFDYPSYWSSITMPSETLTVVPPMLDQRARQHIDNGRALARRGAVFAAREQFLVGLRLVAQSLDATRGDSLCSQALADGLVAIEEGGQFLRAGGSNGATTDLKALAASHRTGQTLELDRLAHATPIVAAQAYYDYAVEKLAVASGGQDTACEALYSIGKLHLVSARHDATGSPLDETKAMVMFQAALAVNAHDAQSANELAVLMARYGRWEEAKSLLLDSLRSQPSPAAWRNLAAVHRALGETQLAELADAEFAAMQSQPHPSTAGVQLVSADQFNQVPHSMWPDAANAAHSDSPNAPSRSAPTTTKAKSWWKPKSWF